MPDRPLIILPAPAIASRGRPPGGGTPPHLPGKGRQGERLAPQFEILRAYFAQRAVDLTTSAAGQVPEEVIVFETVGSVTNFITAARRVQGLDFLAEWDVEDIAPDDDFYDEARRDALLPGRLFLVMSNQQALQQLLGLWQQFRNGHRPARGLAPFFEMFSHLRDLRRWSPKDRLLETGVVEYWKEAAESRDTTPVPFEIELWFRQTAVLRRASVDRMNRIIQRLRGQAVSVCELEPICYHSAVVTLPASEIRRLISGQEADLLGESAIMYFRPSGQAVVPGTRQPDLQQPIAQQPTAMPGGNPTVALFDGLPLENHARLAGRLRVDDPDGYAAAYTANEREHGTTMASIIVHGDLNAPRQILPHPLYVRPILRPDPQAWNVSRDERVPFGVNALDLTHRAVRRLFEGEGSVAPIAPSVKIINFSIGEPIPTTPEPPGASGSTPPPWATPGCAACEPNRPWAVRWASALRSGSRALALICYLFSWCFFLPLCCFAFSVFRPSPKKPASQAASGRSPAEGATPGPWRKQARWRAKDRERKADRKKAA